VVLVLLLQIIDLSSTTFSFSAILFLVVCIRNAARAVRCYIDSVTRIKFHLACIKGFNVKPCPKVVMSRKR
jgi:hypothetical protein